MSMWRFGWLLATTHPSDETRAKLWRCLDYRREWQRAFWPRLLFMVRRGWSIDDALLAASLGASDALSRIVRSGGSA